MHRLACIDLPSFPLQLLLRRHSNWEAKAAVVVDCNQPQGIVLWANENARRSGVLPGQRYAQALALHRDLHADTIPKEEIVENVAAVSETLRKFTPSVESSAMDPGVFWCDATGLQKLYESPSRWGKAIVKRLSADNFTSSVVVGFTRFGSYALARLQSNGLVVVKTLQDERDQVKRVPLQHLHIAPRLRDTLATLGIATVGAFIGLPRGGVLQRFGAEAQHLHELASNDCWDPLQPQCPAKPMEKTQILDDPETDIERLVFVIKRSLDALLADLACRKMVIATLFLQLHLERIPVPSLEVIRPAQPSLDSRSLLRLIHLRLESSPPASGVKEFVISAETIAASQEQLNLFRQQSKRNFNAANEALAQLRAQLGNNSVVRAVVRQGHLPEAQFAWQPVDSIASPNARVVHHRPAIRRILLRSSPLPSAQRKSHDDGWVLDLRYGAVLDMTSADITSGGWWHQEIHREYHYVRTQQGPLLWVYFDRKRNRWFLQGLVE